MYKERNKLWEKYEKNDDTMLDARYTHAKDIKMSSTKYFCFYNISIFFVDVGCRVLFPSFSSCLLFTR